MINASEFGFAQNGAPVTRYTLTNRRGVRADVLTLGAALHSLVLPTAAGPVDVCLGYDTPGEYETKRSCFGATCGRFANRIRNGRFTLGRKTYSLACNDSPNHLHGGPGGFAYRVWDVSDALENAVVFSRVSPDGEEGYPGTLKVSVTYTLSDDDVLTIRYEAVSDADTVLNLTNHTYWNLNGHASGTALRHTLRLPASFFCPCDRNRLVTGELLPVAGTPFDFTTEHTIGERIQWPDEQLKNGIGYDHSFLLDGREPTVLSGDRSGIVLKITTDMPAIQLYTANFLHPQSGKGGVSYAERDAVCLETQQLPDAPNNPQFPSALLKAGERFVSETRHQFFF